jgi:hypothetical protein
MPFQKGRKKTGAKKKGTPNKVTAEDRKLAAEAEKAGKTPLDYLLSVVNDQSEDRDRRLRASAAAAPYCHPRMTIITGPDGQPLGGGFGEAAVHVYLPSNGRDRHLDLAAGSYTAEELAEYEAAEARRLEEIAAKDEELRKLVVARKLTEDQARLARGFYTEVGDPPWEPPPRPPALAIEWQPAITVPEQHSSRPGNGNGTEIELPAKTVLYSAPNSRYEIGKGYIADRWGVITDVELEDMEALIAAGWKRFRDPFGR